MPIKFTSRKLNRNATWRINFQSSLTLLAYMELDNYKKCHGDIKIVEPPCHKYVAG